MPRGVGGTPPSAGPWYGTHTAPGCVRVSGFLLVRIGFLVFGCWLTVCAGAVTCGFALWCGSLFPWLPIPSVISSRKG